MTRIEKIMEECRKCPNAEYTRNIIKNFLLPKYLETGDIKKYNKTAKHWGLETTPEPEQEKLKNIYEIANSKI